MFPPQESVGCDVRISSTVQPLSPQNPEENPPQNAPDNVNIVTGGALNAAGGENASFSSNPTSQPKKKFKLHGNACKSFLQACGVAIVGNAQVMTDRAVILASIILSPNVYENSEIVTGRITRGIIPEALKSHVQMLPPRELEELIDIARAFPKAKTKSKILAEGFIGSKELSVDPDAKKKKEATAKTDIELVNNWLIRPLSPVNKAPSIPQLKNYLKSRNLKATGSHNVLLQRAQTPSAADRKKPHEVRAPKKLTRKVAACYLEAVGFGSSGTAEKVVARAILVAKVHFLQEDEDQHASPQIVAYLDNDKPDSKDLESMLVSYNQLNENHPLDARRCSKENRTTNTSSLVSPTPAAQFSASPKSPGGPTIVTQQKNLKTANQLRQKRLNSLLDSAAKMQCGEEGTDVLLVVRQNDSNGKRKVTVMADDLKSAIEISAWSVKSIASALPEHNFSRPKDLSTCTFLPAAQLVDEKRKKRKINFRDAPLTEIIVDPFATNEQSAPEGTN